MNRFLALPDSEKSAVFRAVGESMGIPAGYVEKDFWVCWMLDVLFSSPDLTTVTPRRTFWEKAFILHEANTAPHEKKPQPRLARHYYDLYQLIKAGIADRDSALFLTVREHRKHYFRQTWVDYEHFFPSNSPSLRQIT